MQSCQRDLLMLSSPWQSQPVRALVRMLGIVSCLAPHMPWLQVPDSCCEITRGLCDEERQRNFEPALVNRLEDHVIQFIERVNAGAAQFVSLACRGRIIHRHSANTMDGRRMVAVEMASRTAASASAFVRA